MYKFLLSNTIKSDVLANVALDLTYLSTVQVCIRAYEDNQS
jgi:hypothetical protein